MITNENSALVAADVMSREVVSLPRNMPLRDVVHLLAERDVSGAPVVDSDGHCIGVFSATDLMRLAEKRADVAKPASPPLPLTCSFQKRRNGRHGKEVVLCTLPEGVCPLQRLQNVRGKEALVCNQPNCVLLDWQVVEMEKLPADEVCKFMTADVVLVTPTTPVGELARMMIDAHIHRLVVVDNEDRPIGIVSSTDLLAVLARSAQQSADKPATAAFGSTMHLTAKPNGLSFARLRARS